MDRKKYHIAEGELVGLADVAESALCVLVMRVPEASALAVSALNFGRNPIRERIDVDEIEALRGLTLAGRPVLDSVSGEAVGEVDAQGGLSIELERWSGRTFIIEQPTP